MGLKYAELPETTYTAGMRNASADTFSDPEGVLSAINGNLAFVLTNDSYPEFPETASLHEHSGGVATCSSYAVCEICGLEYGSYDPSNHSDVITRDARDAVWTTDGYSGDIWCRGCDTVIEEGKPIPADTARQALTVNYIQGEQIILSKTFTVAEFDALKSTGPTLGYSYGKNTTEIMAAKEYVTLEKLLSEEGYSYGNMESITVICDGSTGTISAETLKECNKYYDADGNEFDAPAALCFNYTSLSGTLETVEAECKPNDNIRFGYGISEQQYTNEEAVGGKRLVSPVRSLTVTLKETTGVTVSGMIKGYEGTGSVTVSLTADGQNEPVYSVASKENYLMIDVQPGIYTMTVSADGSYVERQYKITVNSDDVTQDVAIYQLGDVNMNGKVNAADVTMLARHVARIKTITDDYALLLANTNKEGKINAADVTRLARYVAKIISAL